MLNFDAQQSALTLPSPRGRGNAVLTRQQQLTSPFGRGRNRAAISGEGTRLNHTTQAAITKAIAIPRSHP